ncbi:solute carrier organic anion transporter family member 74D isoform X2 [Cherax quadricarinatus]|uniref:solute carrier organic anion transporter family member 74D isoform X2 n=1 Tax=Cherax quadricarinatus TaxID=27406 RepID=UPI00387EA73C
MAAHNRDENSFSLTHEADHEAAHEVAHETTHMLLQQARHPPSLPPAGGLDEPRTSDSDEEGEVLLTDAMVDEILGPESFTRCGVGCVGGGWLQWAARSEVYLLVFSLMAVSQGAFYAYVSSTLTTVERHFNLPSSLTGFIGTGNDVLQVFLSLPLAYFSGYGHRPRWMAAGLLVSTLGCFFSVAPHFIFGPGDYSHLFLDTRDPDNGTLKQPEEWAWCGRGREEDAGCNVTSSTSLNTEQYSVVALQFLGQVLSGFTNTLFYVVGYTYLDEAVNKEQVPLYFAVSGCMRIMGPVVGMTLASWALRQWVDPAATPTILPTHPQWVGAWWIGYPVLASLLVLTSTFLVLMPRTLPAARERNLERLRAASRLGGAAFTSYCATLRPLSHTAAPGILQELRRLSKNRLFLTMLGNQTVFWAVLAGYYTFSGKYKEHQFKMAAADASEYSAMVGLVASTVGWLATGSMLTFLKPRIKVIILFTMGVSLAIVAVSLAEMTVMCERDDILGLSQMLHTDVTSQHTIHNDITRDFDVNIDNVTRHPGVLGCMSACGCSEIYSPVCVDTRYTFYSACHAGCTYRNIVNGSQVYGKCWCADFMRSSEPEVSERGARREARSGVCSRGCDTLWVYLALSTFNGVLVASNRVVANVILFRCVSEREKDLALGVLNVALSLSFVVPPVLVGVVVAGVLCGFFFECLILKWHQNLDFYGHKEMMDLGLFVLKTKKKDEEDTRNGRKEDEENFGG